MVRPEEDKWEPIESLGKTGETVARNIRRIRKDRGLQYTELAQKLKVLEREVPTWGLRKIESGGRRVDADDLMVIAVALGVSPAALLMPMVKDDDSEVQTGDLVSITGWGKPVPAKWVWDWLVARGPFARAMISSFIRYGMPSWEREELEADIRVARNRLVHGIDAEDVDGDD